MIEEEMTDKFKSIQIRDNVIYFLSRLALNIIFAAGIALYLFKDDVKYSLTPELSKTVTIIGLSFTVAFIAMWFFTRSFRKESNEYFDNEMEVIKKSMLTKALAKVQEKYELLSTEDLSLRYKTVGFGKNKKFRLHNLIVTSYSEADSRYHNAIFSFTKEGNVEAFGSEKATKLKSEKLN